MQYIKKFNISEEHNGSYPFVFDSTGGFARYCLKFEKEYKKNNGGDGSQFPILFEYTFEYIQEISDHYRLFGVLYDIRVSETTYKLENELKALVDEKTRTSIDSLKKETETVVEDATISAKQQAKTAADEAEKAKKNAENAVNVAVREKMHEVTEHISETSVTILGMCSGIVLTIVGGLFYSSSVLASVASSNVYKLLAIAAMVGFICINILAVMFHYIYRIRNGKENNESHTFCEIVKRHSFVIALDIVLIVIMVVSAMFYSESLKNKENEQVTQECAYITESSESTEEIIESALENLETQINK